MSAVDFHTVLTVLFFITFIAMTIWVYLPGRKHRYDKAAQLPFAGDVPHQGEKGHE